MSAAQAIDGLVARVAAALTARAATMASAESCTGGLVAAACTSRAGSSAWFERGVVTYSNAAKNELLDVDTALIARHGAVSAEVARAMVAGMVARSPARFAVAVTGIAGPDGGTPLKPVGTVWIATDIDGVVESRRLRLIGDRAEVRQRAAQAVMEMLRRRMLFGTSAIETP